MTGIPVLMSVGESLGVFAATTMLSFALITAVFFGLRWWNKKKHPTKNDIKETNRQRREKEKLKRQTKEKVNAYMRGKNAENSEEHIPNGKRSGKYKKKNKKK